MKHLRWLGPAGILVSVVACPAAPPPERARFGADTTAGHYLTVDNAKIYYEISGQGTPVLLLHGGLFGSIEEFADLSAALRRDHTVLALALRGHGRSELGKTPLSNQRFAEDAAAVLRSLPYTAVDVVGFSSGAMAAYLLAADHPELVRRLVAIGGPIAASGATAAGAAEAESYASPAQLERLYPSLVARRRGASRSPAAWDSLVIAFAQMAGQPDIPEARIRAITQPTLIIAGDRDHYTRTEHFVQIYRLLPRGSLAIIPDCGHVVFTCSRPALNDLVRSFLGTASESPN